MSEPIETENAVNKFDDKRAKKQRGLLWLAVVSKLKLARADVRSTTRGRNDDHCRERAKGEEDKPRHSSCIRACVLVATALAGFQ
jgi:hypothetical protein